MQIQSLFLPTGSGGDRQQNVNVSSFIRMEGQEAPLLSNSSSCASDLSASVFSGILHDYLPILDQSPILVVTSVPLPILSIALFPSTFKHAQVSHL